LECLYTRVDESFFVECVAVLVFFAIAAGEAARATSASAAEKFLKRMVSGSSGDDMLRAECQISAIVSH
jgi:hypothetical protein